MNHHRDFEDLLSALSRERAEFLIVGAYAVMAVTEPRFTKDLDVWIRPTRANARKVHRALERFGAPLSNLKVSDLERLAVPRDNPWGPSIAVNEVRGPSAVGEHVVLDIEMQSGDVIQIEASSIVTETSAP